MSGDAQVLFDASMTVLPIEIEITALFRVIYSTFIFS